MRGMAGKEGDREGRVQGKGRVVLGARAAVRVYGGVFFGRIVMIHRLILEKEQPCFCIQYTFAIMQMATLLLLSSLFILFSAVGLCPPFFRSRSNVNTFMIPPLSLF